MKSIAANLGQYSLVLMQARDYHLAEQPWVYRLECLEGCSDGMTQPLKAFASSTMFRQTAIRVPVKVRQPSNAAGGSMKTLGSNIHIVQLHRGLERSLGGVFGLEIPIGGRT